MNETLYIFEEAVEKGWLKDTVRVVRKDGRLFDYVLDGEEVRPHEVVRGRLGRGIGTVGTVRGVLGEVPLGA